MPEHWVEKLLVGEQKDINVEWLENYAATMVEDKITMGSAENKHIGKNRNKASASRTVI